MKILRALVSVAIIGITCGCVTYYRHMWSPADLRDGNVKVYQLEPDRLVVTEGYVYWLSKSYSPAAFLSLLIRENEDGSWVVRRKKCETE